MSVRLLRTPFLESIVETIPAGVAAYEPEPPYRCAYHNGEFLQLVGERHREAGTIVGVPLAELFDADTARSVEAVFEQVHATGEPHFQREFPAMLPPGIRPRYYRWSLTPIREGEEIAWLVLSAVEVTEHVEARQEAERSEELARRLHEAEQTVRRTLDAMVHQMPVGIVIVDAPDGRILMANEQLELLWQRRLEPSTSILEHAATLDALHPDGRSYDPAEWPVARSAAGGEVVTDEEAEICRPDGARRWISMSSSPIRDESGAVVAAMSLFLDVTERRDAEELRDAFIAVLSHELRTPITAIYAGARMLLRPDAERDAATRADLVSDIAAESERLHRLVDDLLVLARAERGMDLVGEPLLLQHMLPRVVESEQGRFPRVSFSVEIPPATCAVLGDQAYITQVMRNLLSNAAKYGPPEGSVEVLVVPGQGEVRVDVLDRGPGIPERERGSIFRPFYRSPRTADHAPGAGIGLFVVRHLVEAMGGRIWAAERPGGGAAVSFTLRTADDDDASL